MTDYQALTRAGYTPMAAAQIVKDAKAGDALMGVKNMHTVKHMRRFWNDRYGRDIWYVD